MVKMGLTEHSFLERMEEMGLTKSSTPYTPKKGKWRLHKDGSGTCSECGFTQKNVWDMDGWQNFCGHCGADMRGE